MSSSLSQPSSLETHRQQFPALAHKLYFNYGGQGPLPTPALNAILESYTRLQREGPFSRRALDTMNAQIDQTHTAIAQELGVTPDTMTLTESVSVGCNIALWGLPWQAGDRLLMTDCEHPGIVAAASEVSRRFGVQLDTAPVLDTLNGGDPVGAIAERVQPTTRLVILSHILWNTGQVLPLADIATACRRQQPDVLVLVDAAQSVGVLPLNLPDLDIDFYAFTGHKWWCGPDGLGGLYVRPSLRERLHPTFIGWRGIRNSPTGQPVGWQPNGTKYEIATSAFPLYQGLQAALRLHQSWGTALQRYERICALSQHLWHALQSIPTLHCLKTTPPQAGLVSFQVEGWSVANLVQALENRTVLIRLIAAPPCLRVCVHYLTLEAELEALVTHLKNIILPQAQLL